MGSGKNTKEYMTVEILIIGKGGSRSIITIKCFPLNSIITDIIIFKLFIILCTIAKKIMMMARQYLMCTGVVEFL